jgi:hypothetical protein
MSLTILVSRYSLWFINNSVDFIEWHWQYFYLSFPVDDSSLEKHVFIGYYESAIEQFILRKVLSYV